MPAADQMVASQFLEGKVGYTEVAATTSLQGHRESLHPFIVVYVWAIDAVAFVAFDFSSFGVFSNCYTGFAHVTIHTFH